MTIDLGARRAMVPPRSKAVGDERAKAFAAHGEAFGQSALQGTAQAEKLTTVRQSPVGRTGSLRADAVPKHAFDTGQRRARVWRRPSPAPTTTNCFCADRLGSGFMVPRALGAALAQGLWVQARAVVVPVGARPMPCPIPKGILALRGANQSAAGRSGCPCLRPSPALSSLSARKDDPLALAMARGPRGLGALRGSTRAWAPRVALGA